MEVGDRKTDWQSFYCGRLLVLLIVGAVVRTSPQVFQHVRLLVRWNLCRDRWRRELLGGEWWRQLEPVFFNSNILNSAGRMVLVVDDDYNDCQRLHSESRALECRRTFNLLLRSCIALGGFRLDLRITLHPNTNFLNIGIIL